MEISEEQLRAAVRVRGGLLHLAGDIDESHVVPARERADRAVAEFVQIRRCRVGQRSSRSSSAIGVTESLIFSGVMAITESESGFRTSPELTEKVRRPSSAR